MPNIPLGAIDILPGRREAHPEKVDEMALSIRLLGLLQPIIVFPNPEVEGRFSVVAGVHRFLAFKKLGLATIEVRVTEEGEIKRELIEISENVHRCELTLAERDRAMHRYAQLYATLHPELEEVINARRDANLRNAPAEKAAAARVADAQPDAAQPALPTPKAAVAQQFGVSTRTAQRAIKRGQVFSDEERIVLDASGLSLDEINDVAQIDEPADRTQVITLLATGMGLEDALLEVLGPDDTLALGPATAPSDEEWLDTLPIRPRVDRKIFDADALLYRRATAAREAMGRALAWHDLRDRIGHQGLYQRRLGRVLDAPHPRHWIVCNRCEKGISRGVPCDNCKGGGYLIG